MDDTKVPPQSKGQNQSPFSGGLQHGPPPSYGFQVGQNKTIIIYAHAVAFIDGSCLFCSKTPIFAKGEPAHGLSSTTSEQLCL